MKRVLLVQLPVPQAGFGAKTGNIPLAAAWLAQAAGNLGGVSIEILPEAEAAYLADGALLDRIRSRNPDIVGFSVYSWNLERSLFLARRLKEKKGLLVVFGGPEVTPDNPLLAGGTADFLVYGEGEEIFGRLLSDPALWASKAGQGEAGGFFESGKSPYLTGHIAPGIENTMLLETQRGCPFRCSYCFYHKARRKTSLAPETAVLDAMDWALARKVEEVYLLDPCLSARPGLAGLLEKLAARNGGAPRRIGLFSEIRAEAVDALLADRFAAAGFTGFEVGLQSTNPAALKLANRRTDLDRFSRGVRLLTERGIQSRIDLILGLPGDDLAGFMRSVDFLVERGLAGDVQVYPLSVLPGTDFRKRHRELGLRYSPAPPYAVAGTPTFSEQEMSAALDYAEERLDVALYPMPPLDIAWKRQGQKTDRDVRVRIGAASPVAKLYLDRPRNEAEVRRIAAALAHPYQVFVAGSFSTGDALGDLLSELTGANPFTPLEVVFLSPARLPSPERLLSVIRLRRPHFLDVEQRFSHPTPGNRAVVFTLVCEAPTQIFFGEMARQVFRWASAALPERTDLETLSGLDGVLIDSPLPPEALRLWQDRFAPAADALPAVSFSDLDLQTRWLGLTARGQFAEKIRRYSAA